MKQPSLSFTLALLACLTAVCAAEADPANDAHATISGLGAIIDPSGDCRITGGAAHATIAVPAGQHVLDVEEKNLTAPRVLREVTGDFTAEVTISAPSIGDAVTQSPDHRPFQSAGLLLWASAETYVRLERAQINVAHDGQTDHAMYPSWEMRLEGRPLRMGGGGAELTGASAKLRITRTGNKVDGAVSEDGTTWQALDPLILKLPEKVQIGLIAVNNTTSAFEATCENFVCKPAEKAAQ